MGYIKLRCLQLVENISTNFNGVQFQYIQVTIITKKILTNLLFTK